MFPEDKLENWYHGKGHWSNESDENWFNWKWQMRNRLTSQKDFERFLKLSDQEKKVLILLKINFLWQSHFIFLI